MSAGLGGVRAALIAMTDPELAALQDAATLAPSTAPALLAYLVNVSAWERARRRGDLDVLLSPAATIPYDELGQAFATVATMLVMFQAQPRVAALIEAIGDGLLADPSEPEQPLQ